MLVGGTEKLRGGDGLRRRRSSTTSTRRSPSTAGARRRSLRRAGARPARAASGSRAACSPPACRTSAPTSASIRRRSSRSRCRRSRIDRHRQARREDRGHRRTSPGCSRATGTSSSSRWAAAGRPSRRSSSRRRTSTTLLELSRAGRHAASDYLETAALAGVADRRLPALRRRARRRGRRPRTCSQGARLARGARSRRSSSSTAAARRSRRSRRAAASSSSPRAGADVATGYLNAYRAPRLRPRRPDDGRGGIGLRALARAAADLAPRVLDDSAPAPGRAGRRADGRVLHDRAAAAHDCSPPPARGARRRRRARLGQPRRPRTLLASELARVDAEVFLVELKAAAIDVVAEAALERGVEVVFAEQRRALAWTAGRARRRAAARWRRRPRA